MARVRNGGGGYLSAPPRPVIEVVNEEVGHFSHPDGWSCGKSRLWILADKTAVVYVGSPNGGTVRHVIPLRYVVKRGIGLELGLDDPENRVATFTVKPCACGFGAVASAGPVDERHAIKWVRKPTPEWFIKR